LLIFFRAPAPLIFAWLVFKPQNLKKKYDAKWALVTGGSSGLGKALSEKLAQQGLNVVIAALGDDLLKNTTAELKTKYVPHVYFTLQALD
jgi:short-subunit dehydrogenase